MSVRVLLIDDDECVKLELKRGGGDWIWNGGVVGGILILNNTNILK